MSQHQHRRLERGRESKQEREHPFNQPLNKKKSEQSATASPWVLQKLQQFLLSKLDQAPARDSDRTATLRKPDQNQDQSECVPYTPYLYYFGEDNPLRRTVSEPILKVRAKRVLSGRQNPLQRKTSAPPAVRAPDTMGVTPSSALVPKRSSAADTQSTNPIEPQRYGPPQPQEAEPLLHIGVQNPVLLHVMPQTLAAQNLHSQMLTVPSQFITVPVMYPEMSQRPLVRTKSSPAYIQHMHIHTQTIAFPDSIYQQHHNSPHKGIQQHTVPKKTMSSETLYDKKSVEEERLKGSDKESYRERKKDSGTDQLGLQQPEQWKDQPNRRLQRCYHRSLPTRLSSPLYWGISNRPNCTTGLVYDSQMLKHKCDCGDNNIHPEHGGRIKSIWSRLHQRGLRSQCELIKARMATFEELHSVHSQKHVSLFAELSETQFPNVNETFQTQPCGGKGRNPDIVWNSDSSSEALKTAAGSVIELALRVASKELRNGFAVVRPPGHHASETETYGFSIFNSVAIAAKQLQDKLKIKKILIVDWDIHHGSGTEKIFYSDPGVLYISLHRYDDGEFFPGTGEPEMVGCGRGEGFNVNVAWSGGLNPPMGDAEYLAAFRTVVMPIAYEFSPSVVLVSAGFDATEGHSPSLGGYYVSAKCFGVLTRKLMELAEGRIVLVLEGGYDLVTLCDASQACVSALLGNEPEPIAEEELLRAPCANAVESLKKVLRVQSKYWRSVRSMLDTVGLPYVKAERRYSAGSEVASALGGLTMKVPSRSSFSNEPMEHDEADSTCFS